MSSNFLDQRASSSESQSSFQRGFSVFGSKPNSGQLMKDIKKDSQEFRITIQAVKEEMAQMKEKHQQQEKDIEQIRTLQEQMIEQNEKGLEKLTSALATRLVTIQDLHMQVESLKATIAQMGSNDVLNHSNMQNLDGSSIQQNGQRAYNHHHQQQQFEQRGSGSVMHTHYRDTAHMGYPPNFQPPGFINGYQQHRQQVYNSSFSPNGNMVNSMCSNPNNSQAYGSVCSPLIISQSHSNQAQEQGNNFSPHEGDHQQDPQK